MRIPTLTAKHAEREDARQQHEEWYQAFIDGRILTYPIAPGQHVQAQRAYSCCSRRFWTDRGFRIRTRVSADKTTLELWLEQDQRERFVKTNGAALEASRLYREAVRARLARKPEPQTITSADAWAQRG